MHKTCTVFSAFLFVLFRYLSFFNFRIDKNSARTTVKNVLISTQHFIANSVSSLGAKSWHPKPPKNCWQIKTDTSTDAPNKLAKQVHVFQDCHLHLILSPHTDLTASIFLGTVCNGISPLPHWGCSFFRVSCSACVLGLHLVVQPFMFRLVRALGIQHVSTDIVLFVQGNCAWMEWRVWEFRILSCSKLSFWEYSHVLEGSVACEALCRGLRFCGTLLVGSTLIL